MYWFKLRKSLNDISKLSFFRDKVKKNANKLVMKYEVELKYSKLKYNYIPFSSFLSLSFTCVCLLVLSVSFQQISLKSNILSALNNHS